jgi:hypothetical protein
MRATDRGLKNVLRDLRAGPGLLAGLGWTGLWVTVGSLIVRPMVSVDRDARMGRSTR